LELGEGLWAHVGSGDDTRSLFGLLGVAGQFAASADSDDSDAKFAAGHVVLL